MNPEYFKIPKPCSADWNKMTPTELGAFCAQCNKEVVDLYQTPSHEIKRTIAAKNNPCIRILQSQIEEMNFSEWFKSLNLVKQLRYVFLFTLIFVYQSKSHAQESDTTFIPYSNEYLDKLEITNAEAIIEEAETAISEEIVDTVPSVFLDPFIVDGWQVIPPIGEGWMGVPSMMPFIPWNGLEVYEFDIALVGGYILEPEIIDTLPVQLENQIILNENVYVFEVNHSKLLFTYKSIQRQKVRLKITNQNSEVVYFTPIEVGIGENTVSYPLDKFEFGHYTITIETESYNGSTKVIYL